MRLACSDPVSPVRLSVRGEDLGMCLARHQIAGPHREIVQCPHRINGPFNSLARPDEAPRQNDGPAARSGTTGVGGDGRAVGDRVQLGCVHFEAVAQPLPCRLRHDDEC